jgi:hypothetical protein
MISFEVHEQHMHRQCLLQFYLRMWCPVSSWTLVQRHDPHSITKVESLARNYYSTTEYCRPQVMVNRQTTKKNQSSPHRCVKEWKELNNQPIYDGWLLHKLGLRLSPHTKGWSSAAHSAAKQTCQDDHVIVNIQSYFGKLCCNTNMPMLLVLSLVCSMKTKDWGNILAAIHEKHRRIAYSWKQKQQQV